MMRTAKTLEILSYGRKPLKSLADDAIKTLLIETRNDFLDQWPVARSVRDLSRIVES